MYLAVLLLLSTCHELPAQDYSYLVASTSVEHFWVVENGEKREIYSRRPDNSSFRFSIRDPQKASIILECLKCEDKITVKILGKKEDAFTTKIFLENKESLSLKSAFRDHTEIKGLQEASRKGDNPVKLFNRDMYVGRTTAKRSPTLKGGNEELKPGEPKMEFRESDYNHFMNEEEFSLYFTKYTRYKIATVYIIGHDGELIFCGGDPSIVEEVYDLSEYTLLPLKEFLSVQHTEGDKETVEFQYDKVKPYFAKELKLGKWYQIGFLVDDDEFQKGIYLYNFQFMNKEEVEKFEGFFDEE